MNRKLKLHKDHALLFHALSNEFKLTFDDIGAFTIEKGFELFAILVEKDEVKVQEILNILRSDTEATMKLANKLNEWWEAGRQNENEII